MTRIAPRVIYGTDGAGVRRRFSAGNVIPDHIQLEEDLPPVKTEVAESRRVKREKASRTADRRGTRKP